MAALTSSRVWCQQCVPWMLQNFLSCTQVKKLTSLHTAWSIACVSVCIQICATGNYLRALHNILFCCFVTDLEPEILEDLCFDGMFVYTLLTAGLGINNDTFGNVVFSDEVSVVIQAQMYRALHVTVSMSAIFT